MQASWRLIGAISISSLILFLPQSNTAADQPDVTESDPISGAPPPPPVAADAANSTAITNGRILHQQLLPAKKDLVFGVVAFDPRVGCGTACVGGKYGEAVRRWAYAVRQHTNAATTDVAIFTGSRRGSIVHGDPELKAALRKASVRLIEADFFDSSDRVAHRDASRHMWCVVRNRWFVIREFLRGHAPEFRSILMTDIRDALLQADPFAWRPSGHAQQTAESQFSGEWLRRSIVFSGEGSGSVRTLRQSKKGAPRTLQCARDSSRLDRAALLDTDPLNAGVTLGGAEAFLNFSAALSGLIAHVTTAACLDVKDCTDQGLYNLLVYTNAWAERLPHTRRVVLPIERALSYTLGHKKRAVTVDAEGRVRNDHGEIPPVVHQFGKGFAGKMLKRNAAFGAMLTRASADLTPRGRV